ncbi:MAG: hypothetical protein ACI31I_05600 [Bacilli bacterium]
MKDENFPNSKVEIISLLQQKVVSFKSKMSLNDDATFIIGFLGESNQTTKMISLIQFFNAFENTKNNFLDSVFNYLNKNGESILPESEDEVRMTLNLMSDPYLDNPQACDIENMSIRLGSLWDVFSHIVKITFDLDIKIKDVSTGNIFKSEKFLKVNDLISKVHNYICDNNSFGNINCYEFCHKFRNLIVHYCDFNSLKFYSNYLCEKNTYCYYPNGYYFGMLLNDYLTLLEFVKEIYSIFKEGKCE